MSADTYFSGNRSLSGAAFRWSHELRKLPATGVEWEWSDVIGKSESKVAYRAVYRFLQAGCIGKTDSGLYRTGAEVEAYLSEHGHELEEWRACLTADAGEFIDDEHGRVARRSESVCECVECGEEFVSCDDARVHYARVHASQESVGASEPVWEQTTLNEFERVSESLQVGSGWQSRLIC